MRRVFEASSAPVKAPLKAAPGGLGMTIAQETARAVDWATAPKTEEEADVGLILSDFIFFMVKRV